MLATKNRAAGVCVFVAAVAFLLAGCGPPGPRALLEGKRLLDRGNHNEAIEKLQTATTLLSTNAQAWNYLGLAYHRAGQPTNAIAAYNKALAWNRNLLEARFNLGCLWLEQDNPDAAKAEFTAYTLHRPNGPEGWVKLGFAQLRSRETTAAEKSFSEAVRLDAKNADAFNGIGLAQLQRNRPRDAAQYFATALKLQPEHRPAMLNQATVLQANLNDQRGALDTYRKYLALQPKPDDWDAVNAVAVAIEQKLAAPPRPAPSNVVAQTVTNTTAARPQPTTTRPVAPQKTEPQKPAPAPATEPQPATPVEVVKLPPEPVIKTGPVSQSPQAEAPSAPDTAPATAGVAQQPTVSQPPEKRGFFQKLNPVNLFRREPKVTPMPTPLPPESPEAKIRIETNAPSATTTTAAVPRTQPTSPPAKPPSVPRYKYVSPRFPAPGDRPEAERQFAQGVKSRDAGRLSDAAESFKDAVKSDPAYFEAQFSLALVEFELKQYKKSLQAWETTLAIRPDSNDARYNFALALKGANYPRDAANELETIRASSADEARVHLALGNLYAEPLRDTQRARIHYLRVLELSPNHPQSSAIRYWLVSNPR